VRSISVQLPILKAPHDEDALVVRTRSGQAKSWLAGGTTATIVMDERSDHPRAG